MIYKNNWVLHHFSGVKIFFLKFINFSDSEH
jgi:hypothetical protein